MLRSPEGGHGAPVISRLGGCQAAPPGRHWRRRGRAAGAAGAPAEGGPDGAAGRGGGGRGGGGRPGGAARLADVLAGAGDAPPTTNSALGAVALARRLRPAVILLDLGLPYRSGGALLGDLKADPASAGVPVLVVSGLAEALPPAAAAPARAHPPGRAARRTAPSSSSREKARPRRCTTSKCGTSSGRAGPSTTTGRARVASWARRSVSRARVLA